MPNEERYTLMLTGILTPSFIILSWSVFVPLGVVLLIVSLVFLGLTYRQAHAITSLEPVTGLGISIHDLSFFQKLRITLRGASMKRPEINSSPADNGLAFESHNFDGDHGQLAGWYISHPASKGLVLLFHGYGGSRDQLLAECDAFHEMGYSCFLVDFRGSGESSGTTTTIGYREANDVEAALEYARIHFEEGPRILFGHSMGAAAILRAIATSGHDVAALILESPFDRLLSAVKARVRAVYMPETPLAHLILYWLGSIHRFDAFGHNPAAYASHVNVPTLILYGKHDPWVGRQEIDNVLGALQGTKRLLVFPNAAHESFAKHEISMWNEEVGTFLESALEKVNGTEALSEPLPSAS